MLGAKCDQEEGNLSPAAQAVLLSNNQHVDAIDSYLKQKFPEKELLLEIVLKLIAYSQQFCDNW